MQEMVERLDGYGKPAWIALMVLGFIVFWPVGLAIMAYLLWSGRMGCGHGKNWRDGFSRAWDDKMQGFGRDTRGYSSTGNKAFDEYREETLKRLQEESRAFTEFLERLRMAKDRAEFDQFMSERARNPADAGPAANAT